MGLIEKYSGFFIGSDGGIIPDGIRYALELEKIPEEERPELAQNIVKYLRAALTAQREPIKWQTVKRGK